MIKQFKHENKRLSSFPASGYQTLTLILPKPMTKHLETGKQGEQLARARIERLGWKLLAENWRHGHLELDLVAMDGDVLVFIEVKTRTSIYYGHPETFVTPAKQRKLWQAAEAFMIEIGHSWEIRFDIIAIYLPPQSSPVIKHFHDAFWPGWNE